MNIKINKNKLLFKISILLSIYISFYGFIIFIYANSQMDLMNPNTPVVFKIIDEILFLILAVFILVFYNFRIKNKLIPIYLLFTITIFILFYTSILDTIIRNNLSISYMKNQFEVLIFIILLSILDKKNLFNKFIVYLNYLLTAALFISILHYFIFPYEAYSSVRLLGAFSNPNTTGFVSVFNIILSYTIYILKQKKRLFYINIFISIITLLLTMSIAAILQFAFIYILLLIYNNNLQIFKKIFISFVTIAILYIIYFSDEVRMLYEFFEKISVITSGGYTVSHRLDGYYSYFNHLDSISDFIFGYSKIISYNLYDASFLNLVSSYGIIIIILYFVLIFIAIYRTVKTNNNVNIQIRLINLYFLLSVFCISIFTQYQLEINPSLLFIYMSFYLIFKTYTKGTET